MKNLLPHKYVVLQLGARMNYAVPTFLAKANCLNIFYTDIHANHFFLKLIKFLIPEKFLPKKFKRLLTRRLPEDLPKTLVKDNALKSLLHYGNKKKVTNSIFQRAIKENFKNADVIYTNFINDDIPLLKIAKESKIKIVYESITPANIGLEIYKENNKYPHIKKEYSETLESVKKGMELDKIKWKLSDNIIVPSGFCKKILIKMGVDDKKISIVPYGIDNKWFNLTPRPKEKRILYIGQISLAKGIQYFCEAARIISSQGLNYDFRAVGSPKVDLNQSLFKGVSFPGTIPRNLIHREILLADIVVLPTLSDAFAISHIEAMACEVPVITTKNCGSIVIDSKTGFIVPSCNPIALANKIMTIVENRNLRKNMSLASKEIAMQYTWLEYEKNLFNVLKKI